MSSTNVVDKTQLRVFVPMQTQANFAQTTEWEEYLCNNYGGFSINPSELIRGAWRNPDTGNVEHDTMAVYYVWVNRDDFSLSDVEALGNAVRRIYGETAASVIHDYYVKPMIVG